MNRGMKCLTEQMGIVDNSEASRFEALHPFAGNTIRL